MTATDRGRADASEPAEALFTRQFLLLIVVGATNSLGTGALNALLPPFVVDELGGTEATAGIVMGGS